MIGKTISHYKILEKIGEGGMGVVYKAEDLKLKRIVALKFLPPYALRTDEDRQRFVREAQAAAALDHSNVCSVHAIEEADGHIFIVMAYCEGRTLKDIIASGPLGVEQALDVAIQIAEGLLEAHEKGVVHRDIKPGNIMVSSKGQAKMMDFGIAKALGATKVTKTGLTVGTAAYMSPEQARGDEVDHRTDIWSLGVVLCEMLAGRPPFRSEYEMALMYSILNATPEPISNLRSDIPPELERIVGKALEKNPDQRYQSANELLRDLRRVAQAPCHVTAAPADTKRHGEMPTAATGPRVPAPTVAPTRRPPALAVGRRFGLAGLAVAAAAIAGYLITQRYIIPAVSERSSERRMIAVLPFENLGPPDDEYFADGITEEITSRLAAFRNLGVISRTSAFQYKGSNRTVKEIGQELGVDYVLEGSVRWERTAEGQRVRITPQLIRVSDDTHVWSERYDRELASIFAVQSQIAEQVIETLAITLMGTERQALDWKPTDNLDAYQAYLKGLDLARRPDYTKESGLLAIKMFERATELDPGFILAYAELSKAHSFLYHLGYDRSAERLRNARTAADRALGLEAGLPEGYLALGYYYYWGQKDYNKALEALATAQKKLPNDPRVMEAIAYIWRRQGRCEEAVGNLKMAFELNPRDAELARQIAVSLCLLRQYPEADNYWDRAIVLAPDQTRLYLEKANNYWLWLGETGKARELLEKVAGEDKNFGFDVRFNQELFERDYRAALERLSHGPTVCVEEESNLLLRSQLQGLVYWLMGETELANASFDSARVALEWLATDNPEDHRVHSSLGMVYAGLGRKQDAIREGKLGVELYPISKDLIGGFECVRNLALIYSMTGEKDAALDQIEYLLSIPSGFSIGLLSLDPMWDSLREHPRYKTIMQRSNAPAL